MRKRQRSAERQLANAKDRHVAAQKLLSDIFKRQRGPLGVENHHDYLSTEWFKRQPYTNYEIMATHMLADFNESMPVRCRGRLEPQGLEHGFRVIGRILGFAPEAYVAFSAATERPVDKNDLAAIIKDSYLKATQFTYMHTDQATHFEIATGVQQRATDTPPPLQPFVILTNVHGEPIYQPNPTYMEQGEASYAQSDDYRKAASFQKCAALGVPLQRIWNEAVDRCATSPYLFEQSLGQLQLAGTAELELIS